jgi:DNA polymerase-1
VGRGREPAARAEGADGYGHGLSTERAPATAPLLVLDGDSLAHRSYHALPPIEGAGGRPINALVGFANVLLVLLEAERPRAVLACWDTLGTPTYRHRELPSYQAHRPPFEPDIVDQLGRLRDLVAAFGFANAEGPGYEADDFLAAAARAEAAAGGTALVVTSDRDAYQLASDAVTILAPQTGGRPPARIGPAEVVERYGVEPAQVPDFIALRGDPSDGIPGARGIGAKTAAQLLQRYGALDAVIAARGELTARQAESLGDPDLPLYRHVATMDAEAPVAPPPDAVLDRSRAADHARSIGAARLAERLGSPP